MSDERGVVFPSGGDRRRSSTATGRANVAAALSAADPTGAEAARGETNWRTGYLVHVRRLVEAGLASPEASVAVACAGLDHLHDTMRVASPAGESPLSAWVAEGAATPVGTETITGTAAPVRELVLPYRGQRLRGDEVRRQVDAWVGAGVAEPSLAEAVAAVLANPDWLRLEGRTVAVLGAGAEMGPLPSLLRWGARVAAVDLPRPELWERLLRLSRESSGTLVVPTGGSSDEPAGRARGVDLRGDVPRVADWLAEQPGSLVLGSYVYADGAAHVLVSTAVDELGRRLLTRRDDVALAFLATPTDVFVVPGEAVEQATAAYESRSRAARTLGRPLRTVSGGRLLRRNYAAGSAPGVHDSLVPQQGPNYALAKGLQRWRATVARHDGLTVSMNVAPPTRTRSVLKNRALAAAYAGAHRFGVEVFDPSTANVLMAALLVHDLHTGGGPSHEHPWQDEAHAAVHGGLWRAPYAPRSALGLAALLGYGASRG